MQVSQQTNLKVNQAARQRAKEEDKAGATTTEKSGEIAAPDDIATSSTDDMFAFSQIIAGGDKVSKVTEMLEHQVESNKPKPDDEDQAILAFSNELPGNDGEVKVVVENKEEVEKHKKAEQEL